MMNFKVSVYTKYQEGGGKNLALFLFNQFYIFTSKLNGLFNNLNNYTYLINPFSFTLSINSALDSTFHCLITFNRH